MKSLEFIQWMSSTYDIEPVEIVKALKAIEEVSFKAPKYGLSSSTDLFEQGTLQIVDSILSNTNFKRADTKAEKLYSSALYIFVDFLNETANEKNFAEFHKELNNEALNYEKKLRETAPSSGLKAVVDKKQAKPSYQTVSNQKIWNRNATTASEAIAVTDYSCEIDKDHKHFISKFNKKNYVEAHHLIPMKFQEQFDCSLDVHANIVSLCLVCHKKLHFSSFEEKKEVLDKLFAERSSRLINAGINMSINDLYTFYQD